MKAAIIGLGVIGRAQRDLFDAQVSFDPSVHDSYPYDEISGCDFAVVCVGTPQAPDGSADLRHLEAAASQLPPGVPVLLRSTVPPGTTTRLFGDRLACHCPEFMGENPAHPWQRPSDVPYVILGGDRDALDYFHHIVADAYPSGTPVTECSATESELAKYTANLYWATRVTFVNEIHRICGRFGADYDRVRDAWLQDPRMTPDYTGMTGHKPGFDGRCWPKDLSALIQAAKTARCQPVFLECVQRANRRFRQ